jgi:hypothetical protein
MFNNKTLITELVLNKFIDNYSETEYSDAWNKLQTFRNEYKNDKRLYSESTFDAEWIDEIFCEILGYPKKLKSRESWTTNGAGKKEERIDGVFYANDKKTIKVVIELKALDTPDLFKKSGKLSPITQGAKYLFQTSNSELAVVSNFDSFVVFNRKEEFRQSWSIFNMSYDDFKEFYLVMSYNSFYGNLTKLMIAQSGETEKEIDEDFYLIASSIYKSIHNQIKPAYADDLFNKFLAMAYLEDCSKLPPLLIKTIYNRKNDFDQNLKSHWNVFSLFFQTMKNNKNSRENLHISDEIAKLPVWQDISYLGRVKIPKSIIDQVVLLSEYNLKSTNLNKLFFSLTKKIFNPYHGVDFYDWVDENKQDQYSFYKKIIQEKYCPLNLCTSFLIGETNDINHPLIELFNQLSLEKIVSSSKTDYFSMEYNKVFNYSKWFSIIEKADLEDEDVIKHIMPHIDNMQLIDIDEKAYVLLGFNSTKSKSIHIDNYGDCFAIVKSEITDKIKILNVDEKIWLQNYNTNSVKFGEYGVVVDNPSDADLLYNPYLHEVYKKDEFGSFQHNTEYYESEQNGIFIKSTNDNLQYLLSSADFKKYLNLTNSKSLNSTVFSQKMVSDEFINLEKSKYEIKDKINLYEFKLDKLKKTSLNTTKDELELVRIEMMLDSLYNEEQNFYTNHID